MRRAVAFGLVAGLLVVAAIAGLIVVQRRSGGSGLWKRARDPSGCANASRDAWEFSYTEQKLERIMSSIHNLCFETAEDYSTPGNYINGAPAVAGDTCVFGGCDGLLHVVRLASGQQDKAIEAGAYIAFGNLAEMVTFSDETFGNLRVATAAKRSYGEAMQLGYRTGTITGMLTDGLGLLGGTLIFILLGTATAGDTVSGFNIIVEFCEPEDRPTYSNDRRSFLNCYPEVVAHSHR